MGHVPLTELKVRRCSVPASTVNSQEVSGDARAPSGAMGPGATVPQEDKGRAHAVLEPPSV